MTTLSAASIFLLDQAKNDNPLAFRAIADASLWEEPVNLTGERLSWCQHLYQSGQGALWQRALHVLLTTDFNEDRWREKRMEWHNKRNALAEHWLEQACHWRDATSLGFLLSRFNPRNLAPEAFGRMQENIWNTHLRQTFMSERQVNGRQDLVWQGWWTPTGKAWDGPIKSRHFKEFLQTMTGVFKDDQNTASFSEPLMEYFASNVFRHAGRLPITKEWLSTWARKQPWSSKMTTWVGPMLETCLKSKAHEEQAWKDVTPWFNEEGLKSLRLQVGRQVGPELASSLQGLSNGLEEGAVSVPTALNRVDRVLQLATRMGVMEHLRSPEVQTKVFESWTRMIEVASRNRSGVVLERHMPQILTHLQEVESTLDPQFLNSNWRRSRYEKAKSLMWGIENKVLMYRTKPAAPSIVTAL